MELWTEHTQPSVEWRTVGMTITFPVHRKSVSFWSGRWPKKLHPWAWSTMLNEDYRDMLHALTDEKVRFILVGAYALAVHGYPRATMDIDIWVMPSPENADAVLRALSRFGAPLHNLTGRSAEGWNHFSDWRRSKTDWHHHRSIRTSIWADIPKFNLSKHRGNWSPHPFHWRSNC